MMNIKNMVAVASLLVASVANAQSESRETVTFAQVLEPESTISLYEQGQKQSSKAFFRTVSGADLKKGVSFITDGDSAVIQLSPLDSVVDGKRQQKLSVPRNMTLSHAGKSFDVESDEIALHRRSQALKEAYPEMYGRAHVMQIPANLGAGEFSLKADASAHDSDRFVLYVLDRNSDISLEVATAASGIAAGEAFQFDAAIAAEQRASMQGVRAELVAPDGSIYPLKGQRNKGRFSSQSALNVKAAGRPGELWTLRVNAKIRNAAGELVERITRVAVNVHETTASLAAVDADVAGLSLGLSIAREGRYEIRALVFGRDYDGEQKPAVLAFQAQWLKAGDQTLKMAIDQDKLKASGLSAPYTVKRVKLMDQGRMAVLESLVGEWAM